MKKLDRHEYTHEYDIHKLIFSDLQDNADTNQVLLSTHSVKGGKL